MIYIRIYVVIPRHRYFPPIRTGFGQGYFRNTRKSEHINPFCGEIAARSFR
jgi:hypothetical protein